MTKKGKFIAGMLRRVIAITGLALSLAPTVIELLEDSSLAQYLPALPTFAGALLSGPFGAHFRHALSG
jgi:hypothetical protein